MSTNSRHLGRGESGCPVPCGAEPDTTFKDQLLLRTYPGTERSSLPTAGVHDLRPGLSDQSPKALIIRPGIIRICFLFTMSWNPQERACRLLAGITHSSETCFGRSRRIGDRPQLLGGARRDRTDDLMLAKHALSQLSYGPSWRTDLMRWWAWEDSNLRPHAYQARALTN